MENKWNEAMHESLKALVNEPLSPTMLMKLRRSAHLVSQFLALQSPSGDDIGYDDLGVPVYPPAPAPLLRRFEPLPESPQQPDYVALLREFMPLIVGAPPKRPLRLEELMEALESATTLKDHALVMRLNAKVDKLLNEDDLLTMEREHDRAIRQEQAAEAAGVNGEQA